MPSTSPPDFQKKLLEISQLYEEVKSIILLAEYEHKDQKFLLSSANELRSALDHIMRAVLFEETAEINFGKTKGHLYRAGYDAYEIIAISKLHSIKTIKEQFSYSAIIEAYPDYHRRVVPLIQDVQNKLVHARSHKSLDQEVEQETEKRFFTQHETIVSELTQIVDDLHLHMDGIKEADENYKMIEERLRLSNEIIQKEQHDKKYWYKTKSFWLGNVLPAIIVGVIVVLASLFMEYGFFAKTNNQNSSVRPDSSVTNKTLTPDL